MSDVIKGSLAAQTVSRLDLSLLAGLATHIMRLCENFKSTQIVSSNDSRGHILYKQHRSQ